MFPEVMEKGLNTELYWKNDDPTHTVSMVPTSAITGEGIPDLLLWLVKLTQVGHQMSNAHLEDDKDMFPSLFFFRCIWYLRADV